jgi:teichuronic acid biosynthesis glycosyltransferase TuaG
MGSLTPLISIIMPTFNQEAFIGKAIESVLEQTYVHWELLIINNFSTDGTKDVVTKHFDPRIQIIDFANKGVIAASRNVGIQQAKGSYLAFLDSDDYWAPNKLQLCIEQLNKGAHAVCHAEYFFKDNDAHFTEHFYGPSTHAKFESMMVHGNCLSTSAIVVRTDLVRSAGGFSENPLFITAEDFDLWLSLAKNSVQFKIMPELLGYYRIHATSASASNIKNARATLHVVKSHLKDLKIKPFTWIKSQFFQARIRFFLLRQQWNS